MDQTPTSNRPASAVRLLAVLVALEAAFMVVFIATDLASAARGGDAEWGAVWFVVVVLGLWSVGLGLVARGVVAGRRWAFTPILFTQGLFGIAAISFFGAADTVAKVVWGAVLIYCVVVLRVLFSREVKEHLIYANS